MRIRLIKAARINHSAGEIVEVDPAQAAFLLSVGAAVVEKAEKRETVTPKKTEQRKKK